MAIILALQKLPSLNPVVAIITDSLYVCSSLSTSGEMPLLKLFRILVPAHLQCLHLIWVPGHKGLFLNENADSSAKAALLMPIIPLFPLTTYITTAQFRTLT